MTQRASRKDLWVIAPKLAICFLDVIIAVWRNNVKHYFIFSLKIFRFVFPWGEAVIFTCKVKIIIKRILGDA